MKFNSFYLKIYLKTSVFTTVFMAMITLSGCANIPNHVIIAPDIATPRSVAFNKETQFNVVDMRTAHHIVQIIRKGEAATLISAQSRLEDTIKNSLRKHWQAQGLVINDNAINTIDISIEKAIISVNQEMMKYTAQTEIVIKVTVYNGTQTLVNTFTNRGNSNGPLQADIAVLERNFNQRLTNLLQQILANKKISNSLK